MRDERARVAQLADAPASRAEGYRFESCPGHQRRTDGAMAARDPHKVEVTRFESGPCYQNASRDEGRGMRDESPLIKAAPGPVGGVDAVSSAAGSNPYSNVEPGARRWAGGRKLQGDAYGRGVTESSARRGSWIGGPRCAKRDEGRVESDELPI